MRRLFNFIVEVIIVMLSANLFFNLYNQKPMFFVAFIGGAITILFLRLVDCGLELAERKKPNKTEGM